MKIGQGTYIGEPSNITAPIEIGAYCSIAPHVQMHNLVQHDYNLVTTYPFDKLENNTKPNDPIIIGNDVWIGQGAIILGPVNIGDGAVIGAYSVVAKDVEPYEVVVGNPAKTIKWRFDPPVIRDLLNIKWWDWSEEQIKERMIEFKDLDSFLKKYI